MNFKPVFYVNGILLLVLAAAMVAPLAIDLSNDNPDWQVFASAQVVTAFVGLMLMCASHQKKFHIGRRDAFLLTTLSWLFMSAFGALPFCFAEIKLSYPQAFFEAMSGITTTGSTVLSGLDQMPHGILLWRAILHWLGGMGFLIIALAVLPMLQVSGMQIFKSNSFSDFEKILPSADQIAVSICLIYAGMTVLCTACLNAAGMTLFEAVCHAMSTMSTGGFSTSDASVGHFQSKLIDLIIMLFMLLASLPFFVYVKIMRSGIAALWKDSQVMAFLSIVASLTLMLSAYLVATHQRDVLDALRNAGFMVISIISTTGFASGDYTLWGPFAIGLAFLITFIGACSGSTVGGLKTFRLQILWEMSKLQLKSLLSPNGVFNVRYNGKIVAHDIQAAIASFFMLYIATWVIVSIALQLTGMDFITAFSGSATAISNVGPGIGNLIGPAGSFSSIGPAQAWILSAAMLLGRVEFMVVLVLFMPRFWRG